MNDQITADTEAASAQSDAPGHIVYLHLANGERIEAGSFPEAGQAHAFVAQLISTAASPSASWPRIGDRYLRPETIVSIDVEQSNQPRWTGSTGRATTWGGPGAS